MPDIPPFLADDPSSAYPAYFDAQRKQMLAQMLMQNMQQSGQTPANWDSMRLVPRRSPLSAITQVMSGALAGKGLGDAQQAEMNYWGKLYGGGSPQGAPPQAPQQPQSLPAAPPADPSEVGPQPLIARNGQTLDQVVQGAQPPQAAQPPASGLPNQGFAAWKAQFDASPPGRFMRFSQPAEYAKLVAEQSAKWNMPSDQVKNILAARLPPELEHQALVNLAAPVTGGERPGMPTRQLGRTIGFAPDPSASVYYDVGPNGEPIARPIPGQQAIVAHGAGLTKAEQEANTPREIPIGGGATRFGYPETPPALRDSQPTSYFGPPRAPSTSAPPQAPKPPDGSPWASVPKVPIPNTPGQSSNVYQQQILKNAGAKDEELVNKLGSESDLADQRLAFNKEALGVLSGAETGPLSDTMTQLRARAQELGMSPQWIPGGDTVGNTQLLKKFLLRNPLLNLKPTFGGRPAAAEFQVLANDASPSPSMLKSTIARLVQMDSTQAQYQKQRAADYQRYQMQGGDPRAFETWYSNKYPMGRFFLKSDTPPQALDILKKRPETADKFRKNFGWAPYPDEQ